MIEANVPPLPADIEGLLAAERDAPVPVGVEHRVLVRVEQTVAAPPAPAATGAAWVKPLLAVVAAVGIGAGVYGAWPGDAPAPAQPIAVPDAPIDVERPTAVPPIAVAEAAAHPVPEPARERAPARDTLAAERALLDRAQGALLDGDTSAAADAVAEHRRSFRRGHLVEEREALRVQVLARAGRVDEAARVAERFLARYPRSIHRAAVRSIRERAP